MYVCTYECTHVCVCVCVCVFVLIHITQVIGAPGEAASSNYTSTGIHTQTHTYIYTPHTHTYTYHTQPVAGAHAYATTRTYTNSLTHALFLSLSLSLPYFPSHSTCIHNEQYHRSVHTTHSTLSLVLSSSHTNRSLWLCCCNRVWRYLCMYVCIVHNMNTYTQCTIRSLCL